MGDRLKELKLRSQKRRELLALQVKYAILVAINGEKDEVMRKLARYSILQSFETFYMCSHWMRESHSPNLPRPPQYDYVVYLRHTCATATTGG